MWRLAHLEGTQAKPSYLPIWRGPPLSLISPWPHCMGTSLRTNREYYSFETEPLLQVFFSSSPLLIFISNTPSPIISLQICPFFFALANASSLMERRSQSLLWAFYSFLVFPQATPQSVTKQNFCHDSPWYEPTKKSQLGRSIKSRLCSSEYNLVSSDLFCCR